MPGRMLKWMAGAVGVAAGAYGTWVGLTWARYGHTTPPTPEEIDALVDRVMPEYEASERSSFGVWCSTI